MNLDDDDEKNIKKTINNNITYIINKKMKNYNNKLEYLEERIEENIKISNSILELLKSKDKNIKKKQILNKLNNEEEYINNQNNNNNNDNNTNDDNDNNDNNDNINHNIFLELNKDKLNDYKNIKRESFDLNYSFVKQCLDLCSINGDIKIFKKIYIDNIPKEFYPIRHIKKKLQYWLNGHMIDDDLSGTYIKNTIIKNIEDCYLSINTYENYENNSEQFFKNQEHINKLSEDKYKDSLLNKIISIITI